MSFTIVFWLQSHLLSVIFRETVKEGKALHMRLPGMPSNIVFGLMGASVASGLFAFTSRATYRRVALCLASGAAAGAALTYYNDSYHCIDPSANYNARAQHISGQPIHSYRPPFETLRDKIFEHITGEYNDLGQIARGEESVTVQPHVFAQIGVIDEDGIRKLWRLLALDTHPMTKYGTTNAEAAQKRQAPIVFCDLGSGVGNVCLQILGETTCDSVVGVEIIPSRHEAAQKAFENAKRYFPTVFGPEKHAAFIKKDIVECASDLNNLGVTVIFTHSWMFDDDLMQKVTTLVNSVPTLNTIVTSRPLDENILRHDRFPLTQRRLAHFSADWNERSPFYVYSRAA